MISINTVLKSNNNLESKYTTATNDLNNFENVTHSAQGETVFWGEIFCLEHPS